MLDLFPPHILPIPFRAVFVHTKAKNPFGEGRGVASCFGTWGE
jgi:hypothetical protein